MTRVLGRSCHGILIAYLPSRMAVSRRELMIFGGANDDFRKETASSHTVV